MGNRDHAPAGIVAGPRVGGGSTYSTYAASRQLAWAAGVGTKVPLAMASVGRWFTL
jgi:hypothetical protein